MKIFISLSAANHPHKKGDRVIVKVGRDEWYLGTVTRSGARIYVDFDDGHAAVIDAADFKDVRALVKPKKAKRAFTNAEAKELYATPKGRKSPTAATLSGTKHSTSTRHRYSVGDTVRYRPSKDAKESATGLIAALLDTSSSGTYLPG